MKKVLAFCYCLLATLSGNAQGNHVPNGSFELYSLCPNALTQIERAAYWDSYDSGTPDYFNSCGTNGTGVPNNFAGIESAAQGNAYAGLFVSGTWCESLMVPMYPLNPNRPYEVSLSVSRGDSYGLATDSVSMFFFQNGPTWVFDGSQAVPQVTFDNGIPNNANGWTRLTKTFVPDSAYDHLVISMFHIPTSMLSYFYIDSVVVKQTTGIGPIELTDTSLCAGEAIQVPYTVILPGFFNTGNVFTLQMSDANGSFASPTVIGSVTATASGTIPATIPATIATGSGYRFRIRSTLPIDSAAMAYDVSIGNVPAKPVISGNTTYCTSTVPVNLSATCATPGVKWRWTGPSNFSNTLQNPTVTMSTTAYTGNYIVEVSEYGCSATDTLSVVVNLTPVTPAVANNGPLCSSDTLFLTSATSTPGVSYLWAGPSFSSVLQNPFIPNSLVSHSGDYTVTVTQGNCSASATTTVVVGQGPLAGLYVSPNDTICAGTTATFVAMPQFAGSSPVYRWLKNGVVDPAASGLVYPTANLVTGDKIEFEVTGGDDCINTVSGIITMTVLPIVTQPSVTIASNPAQPRPGELANFTATPLYGGPTPHYQWMRNGIDIPQAIYATWSTADLTPWERVSVKLISNDPCAHIDTAISNEIIAVFPTAINDINNTNKLQLFPNPNKGNFTVKWPLPASPNGRSQEPVLVEVVNAVGQIIYMQQHKPVNGVIEVSLGRVAAGVYMVKIGGETLRFVVE